MLVATSRICVSPVEVHRLWKQPHCLPACIKFGFHWTDFREIRYWDFAKICRATPDVVKMGLKDADMENQVLLYCWQQYETFCDSTVVRRERIVAFAWQHWTLLPCWQLHTGQQQYKGNVLLRFRGNNYANAPQCYIMCRLFLSLSLSLLGRSFF